MFERAMDCAYQSAGVETPTYASEHIHLSPPITVESSESHRTMPPATGTAALLQAMQSVINVSDFSEHGDGERSIRPASITDPCCMWLTAAQAAKGEINP
jgi:hypothetical protein